MSGLLAGLAKSFFGSIIESFMAYFEKESAEAAKWDAQAKGQQLESIKVGMAKEAEWAKKVTEAPSALSVSAWNAGAKK